MHLPRTRKRAIALYLSGLSARDVTERILKERNIYVSPQTVARWMRELGKSRPVGGARSMELGKRAKRLYESGLTIERIADRFRIGKTTVTKRLQEMGVAIRPSGSRFLHVLTEPRLRSLYVDRDWSVEKIAAKAGCSVGTVYRLLALRGIRRPSR